MSPNKPSITTVFCDDIRLEVANKISLIGVYAGDILVNKFPALLPKLCVWVNITAIGTAPLERALVRLLRDDKDVVLEGDAIGNEVPPKVEPGATVSHIVALELSPYRATENHSLSVDVEIDGVHHRSRSIRIAEGDLRAIIGHHQGGSGSAPQRV
jgi:hypothetical protein